MNVKERLIEVLETFCPDNVYLSGTMEEDQPYPDTFITIWTDNTEDNGAYDNDIYSVIWDFTVILYSSDPEIINTKPCDILTALKSAGFIPQGKGQDIPSDVPSHTGWAMDILYKEII